MMAAVGLAVAPDEFARMMAALGPFAPGRRVAVAVSGGADSMALALLAADWGNPLCLVIDHGLRAGSATDAALTAERLGARGIAHKVLTLTHLAAGPGLAARARAARYEALIGAVREAGLCDVLLGHHARDQAETRLIRARAASGEAGLAGMAAIVELPDIRLLRPLLAVAPGRLRVTLRDRAVGWVEDPSNTDMRAERVRHRVHLADADGDGAAVSALLAATQTQGVARAADDVAVAAELAAGVEIYPQGFAVVRAARLTAKALGALIRAIGGGAYPAPTRAVAHLAADLRPATLAGTRLLPAGKYGPGFLLVREAAAIAASVPGVAGMVWDRRFRLDPTSLVPAGAVVTGGGGAAHLPAAVRAAMPRLMLNDVPLAAAFWYSPAVPAAGAPFALGIGDFGGCEVPLATPC